MPDPDPKLQKNTDPDMDTKTIISDQQQIAAYLYHTYDIGRYPTVCKKLLCRHSTGTIGSWKQGCGAGAVKLLWLRLRSRLRSKLKKSFLTVESTYLESM